MKWIGLLALSMAGTFVGIAAVKWQHQRVHILQLLIQWLRDFERRLQYTAPPVREWLEESANVFSQLPFIAAVCCALQGDDLQTAWERAVLVSFPRWSAVDTAPLRALGAQLGKSEAHTQRRCVQEAVAALEERRTEALSAAQKADKLYMTLGLSGGLAMALLWI